MKELKNVLARYMYHQRLDTSLNLPNIFFPDDSHLEFELPFVLYVYSPIPKYSTLEVDTIHVIEILLICPSTGLAFPV